jgi:hypothetical protein
MFDPLRNNPRFQKLREETQHLNPRDFPEANLEP